MEGDKTADNEKELTSTSSSDMDKLLSTNKEDKNDSNDTLPTSSTDASTSVKLTHLVSDDPISSTSSEMDPTKSKTIENTSTHVLDKASTFQTEVELLDMSMATQPTERIEENVDDLVSDLETLLGESAEPFSLPFKAAEASEKTEAISAVEEISNLPEDKPENEVSSNTDSSPDKNLNEDEPAFSEVEKTEQETVHDDISHKLEDGAKDVNGGGDFKSSDDNSGQDSTQPQKLDIIESVKDDSENIKESPKGYSEEVRLKEIANIENFSTAEPGTNLTTESKGPIEGTSSIIEKVAESPDNKSSECLENVATHDCTEKTEEVNSNMSLEAKGPETGHSKIVKDTLEEVCEKDTTESEETSVVESKKETQSELVENKPTYTTEDVTDKNVQVHVIEEISEVNSEPEQTFIKPNEDSSKCEGNKEINQPPEKSSVENMQDSVHSQPVEESNQSSNIALQDQCQEMRSGKRSEQELDKDFDPPEEDTEQIKEENDQKDNLNISHQEEQSEKEHRVQTFCEEFDNSGVTNQDTKPVQEINEGAEEVEESNICASTEESSNSSGKKTKTLEVIKDVTEREEKEVKKIEGYPEVSKKIEPTETESDNNQQGQDSTQSDLNILPDSSPIISEELVEGNNLSKYINASEIVEVTEDVGILRSDDNKHETEEIESAEENNEHNKKIADLEKLSSQPKVDLEVPSKTSEEQFEESITFNELKEPKADFQETTRVSCEEQAETSKDSRDSQQECPDEDNCESVQDAFDKDADIAESGQDSRNVDKTDDQSQDTSRSPPEEIKISEQSQDTSKSLPEEIEISELAETSAPAGEAEVIELEPVIEEPEENTQYSSEAVNEEQPNAEIIEVKESENKLPLIFKDLKDNHEDLTNIASTEKPGSSIEKCKRDEEIVEASENVGTKSKGEVTSDKKDSITTEFLEKESESDEVVKVVEETSFKQVDIEDKLTNEVEPEASDIIVLNEMKTQEDTSVASKEELDASEKNKSGTEEQNPGKNEVKYDEETNIAVSEPNDKIEDFTGTLKEPKENEQEIIENVSLEPEIVSLHTETSEETCSEGKEKASDKKDTADENNENSRKTIELMEVGAPVQVTFNSALHEDKNKEFVDNMDVGDVYVDKNKIESVEVGAIEEGINIKAKEIKADSDCLGKVIKEASFVATKTFDIPVTVNLCEQEPKSKDMIRKSFKEDNFFTPRDTDISEAKKNKRKIGIIAKHVQEIKPTPEINIRRKTVEQDLEKVVCLSEESSDSDTNEEVTKSLSTLIDDSKDPDFEQDPVIHDVPLTDDLPPNQEESALIQIAQEVEKLQNVQINELVPNIHSNENIPCIEDILSDQPQEIPVDAGENLETILAVASLQNDPVTEVKVERRLSEKELREMEAIRMAVASITDSSQDTYDSYLVESSMTMESSIPESSSDVQEFSNDVQELSNDTQELSSDVQILSDDTQNLTEFEMKDSTIITDNSREVVVDQHSILPDDDLEKEAKNKTEKNINKDIVNKYVSKTEDTDRSDLSPTHDAATDVKDIEEADSHPTPNDEKDMTQQPSSSDTKESEESLNAENIRETTDIRDVSEQSKVLSPEQSIKKNDDVISDQDKQKELSVSEQLKETSVAITEQVEQAEESKVSISKEVVKSNETPELKQSVNKKEDLLSDDVCADEVSAPEQVVEEKNVTTTRVVEEQEISISKGTVEEVIDKPEPVVSENTISTSENVKENETAPLPVCEEKVTLSQPAIEKDIVISKQVVQDKKVTTPKHIEDNEIDASKQEVEEKDIVTPKHVVEEKKVLPLEEDVKEKQISSSEPAKEKEILIPNQVVEEKEVLSPEQTPEDKKVLTSEPVVKGNEVLVPPQIIEERTLRNRTRRLNKVSEPLSISVEEVEKKEKPYSPKVTIKPVKVPDEEVSTTSDAEGNKGSLKITITKQSDKMHSILKVYNPDDDPEPSVNQEEPIPKLIIKPKMQQVEQQHSPKMSTRSSKVYSPTSTQRCSSPRVTIKPVVKPTEAKTEAVSPLKITFKPVVKPDEASKKHSPKTSKEPDQKNHNPKITIKPIPKPSESDKEETSVSTPKVTIKPIKRHIEDNEVENEHERSSPKIIIKPVVKPAEQDADHTNQSTPKLKIKPIKKHEDEENSVVEKDRDSPKISFKPVVKPVEADEEDEEVKERIVLKINKGNLPTPSKESRKREYPEDEKTEKMGKLKLKFSTTGGQTHIVQEVEEGFKRQRKDSGYAGKKDIQNTEEVSNKRTSEDKLPEKNKRLRSSITPDKINEDTNDDVKILGHKLDSPIVISEDSRSQHSADCVIIEDSQSNSSDISKISDIASRTTHIEATPVVTVGVVTPSVSPAPKKRGRPRKVPLEVREELKDLPTTPPITPLATPQSTPVTETSILTSDKSEPGTPITTPSPGGRPKRSCRGQNVMATLGIKPRKPRGRGMGRGSKVNMGDREPVVQSPVEPVQTVTMKPEKEPKLSKAKLKLIQKAAEEAKRQKEDAIKQEEEAEPARASQKEEENIKQEEAVEQKEDEGKINLELKKKQDEEQLCKKQEEGKQRELSGQNLKSGEEEKNKIEIEKGQKQVIEIETKSFQQEQKKKDLEQKTQKGLDERSQKEIEEQTILEAEETHRKQDEVLKRKKEEGEGQTPPKKKKEDKTPPRKLEVTTRRQKAQLQKAAEEAEKAAAEAEKTGAENKTEARRSVGNPKNLSPKKVAALEPTTSADSSCSDTATILLDIKEEREEEENKLEVEKDSPKEKGKKTPEQKGKGKNTLDKVKKALEKAKLEEEKKAEEEERKVEEQKKADEQRKAEQERKADEEKRKAEEERKAAEEERKAAEEKKALEEKKAAEEKKALEEKKAAEEKKALEEKKAAEEKALEEKKAAEKKALDERNAALKKLLEENKDDTKTESKKSEEAPGDKKSEASAEDDEESEDSEVERQRELIKQKKQEAIKKCRAKRMEKLAKAAEMKRKRQEQAAQQRAARLAAEEAERIAAEKARVNRRYGRYGNPKPQISLIDEPVRETAGTIKSPMGLFNPQTEQIMIRQPIVIDDDSNFAEKPLKQLDVTLSSSSYKLLAPPTSEPMAVDSTEETPTKHRRPIGSEDIMMVDEETRMSADFRGSRAQTPAKQPIAPPETMIEDSQGSNGTESVGGKSKSSKAPKMEVFQDLESIQVTAEQLAEYSWNGRGPFMIQEQVSLFLGIKSFKRKYPNCQRRTVDMQERDYLKENGFVTEAQCDLGLTAVNSQDILDIMYADFQDKYEEYCKVQREKQDRELANKQKALSQFTFKPGYEKLDIIEQAVQSAAAWNQQFNKTRREERKAHMDLQNLTVHYPKTKVKVIPTQKIGDHPIALVPGQFTDYYKAFTPTELNNLPLNTMCYDEIKVPGKDSDSDDTSSGSDSDSDSSSDSSCSSSSCDEDCKECVKHGNAEVNGNVSNDVTMDNNGSNDSVVLVSVTTPA